jgi:hypothetical protein
LASQVPKQESATSVVKRAYRFVQTKKGDIIIQTQK